MQWFPREPSSLFELSREFQPAEVSDFGPALTGGRAPAPTSRPTPFGFAPVAATGSAESKRASAASWKRRYIRLGEVAVSDRDTLEGLTQFINEPFVRLDVAAQHLSRRPHLIDGFAIVRLVSRQVGYSRDRFSEPLASPAQPSLKLHVRVSCQLKRRVSTTCHRRWTRGSGSDSRSDIRRTLVGVASSRRRA